MKILLIWLSLVLSGCSTFETMGKDSDLRGYIYSGSTLNFSRWYCFSKNAEGDFAPWRTLGMAPYLIIDLPFSLVADTIYLPFKLSEEKGEGLGVMENPKLNCDKVKL